jgi:hypothetical protein
MNENKTKTRMEKVEKDWKYTLENKTEQKKFEFYNGQMVFR